jgi:hypothetical protein
MADRDRMERRAPWIPWAMTSLALVLVAVVAYGFGARRDAADAAGESARRVWFYGGFPPFWLFFVGFWLLGGFRWMWWGYHPHGPWRYRRYRYQPYEDERADWEEWHRQAHNRVDSSGPRSASPSANPDRGPIT